MKTETENADKQVSNRDKRRNHESQNTDTQGTRAAASNSIVYTGIMCFVDFKKVFDSISHDKLWVTMMDMGYSLHLIDFLAKLQETV